VSKKAVPWGARADPELKYAELAERLNLADEDLMRTLHSLSCAKYKILNKAPEGRSIGKEDVFSVNRKFTDRMRRIKVRGQQSLGPHTGGHAAKGARAYVQGEHEQA